MAEILSAQELQALLSEDERRPAEVEAPPGELVHHSFDGPPPLPRGGIERLTILASKFAEQMRARLASELRREAGVALARVDLFSRAETEQLLPGSVHLAFERADGARAADLLLDSSTALALVEARLGGAIAESQPRRPLTPIEGSLLKRLLKTCTVPALLASFGDAEEQAGAAPECTDASGFAQGSGFLALQMQVSVVGRGGAAVLVLAATRASGLAVASSGAAQSARRGGMRPALLAKLPVRIVPRIPGGAISLSDLMRLAPGQVVRLDRSENAAIEVLCNGEPVLEGRLIRVGPMPALEIEGWRSARSAREEKP